MQLKSKLGDARLGTKDEFLFDVTQLGMCCDACRKSGAACNHRLSMNPSVLLLLCIARVRERRDREQKEY